MIDKLHNVILVIVTIAIILNDGYLPNPLYLVMQAFDMPAWRALCVIYGSIFCSKYIFIYLFYLYIYLTKNN